MLPAGVASLRHPLCVRRLFSTILSIGWTLGAVSTALKITSTGTQTMYVAENQDIVIGCTYEVEAVDVGSLDIEWSIVNPDTTQQDRVILTYLHDQLFEYPNPLSGRFGFMEADPSQGNASVRIRNLQASDTNTFQCKVKKAPGIDSRKVTVGVHVRPGKPECWIDRSGEEDRDVVLHCVSQSGTPPLTYSWGRINVELPPQSTLDGGSGILLIKDSTPESDGTYHCSVSNLAGERECELVLSSTAGHSKVGMIVGIVLGVLLALLLLLLLLWLLCCCRRRRHKTERPNDIREDSAAPGSRSSSVRSVPSYKAHQLHRAYHPVNTMDSLPSPSLKLAALYRPLPGVSPAAAKNTFVV